ncbi:Imm3 family immunity protein [Peribacillus sp. Hz7]|uniref:Imm3 family immunity protein n=1 Tax=Peribacillus sp. Hz7 TaxID=3344873 RepID=UPI0035CA7FD9
MEHFTYNELFEVIQEDYQEYLNKNRGNRYAIARAFNENLDMGNIEGFIVYTAIGEILITHDKVFNGYLEAITNKLNSFNPKEASGELTAVEIENLSKRIKEVLEGLNHVEVDYKPNTDNRD